MPSLKCERPYLECKRSFPFQKNYELSAIILKPITQSVSTGLHHFGEPRAYEAQQFQLCMLTLGWVCILGKKRNENEHLFNFIRSRAFLNDIEGCTLFQWHLDFCSIDANLRLCLGRYLLRQAYYGTQQFQPLCLLKHGTPMENKKKTSSWAFPKLTLSKKMRQDTYIQLAVKQKEWSFKKTKTTLSLLHQLNPTSSLQVEQKFFSNFLLSSANVYWSFQFPLVAFIRQCLIRYKLEKHSSHISAQATLSAFRLKKFHVFPSFHIGTNQVSVFFFHLSKNHFQQDTLFHSHQSKNKSPFGSCGYHEDYGVYFMYVIDCCRFFPKDWDFLCHCNVILYSKNNVLHSTMELRLQYCGALYRFPLTLMLLTSPKNGSTWLRSGMGAKYIVEQVVIALSNIAIGTEEYRGKKNWEWLSFFNDLSHPTVRCVLNRKSEKREHKICALEDTLKHTKITSHSFLFPYTALLFIMTC